MVAVSNGGALLLGLYCIGGDLPVRMRLPIITVCPSLSFAALCAFFIHRAALCELGKPRKTYYYNPGMQPSLKLAAGRK